MKLTQFAALACAAVVLAGCNRNADQGGVSQEPAAGSRRESSAPAAASQSGSVAPTAPVSPAPSADRGISSTTPASDTDKLAKPADNTGRNVRDRDSATVTPGDQSESKTDLELTRRLRQAVNQDNQLSVNAKNIKIVTAGGKVTLRGPVNSAAEQQQILDKVQKVEGVSSVDNQLEVKNNP